jgi:hypothetical protein
MLRKILVRWSTPLAYAAMAAGVLALLAFCAVGVAISLSEDGFGAEAAAWAQAAGSIAAIAGAVWLSRLESMRERRQRRHEREETAWAVRFAIVAARNEAYTVAHELVDPDKALASENGRHWRTRCRNVRMLLQSYAGHTDHIHPAIVQDANNAVLLAEEMEADVERAAQFMAAGEIPSLKVAEDLAWYEIQFATLIQRVDDRMAGVREALDRGGDMLPKRDFQWNRKTRNRAN